MTEADVSRETSPEGVCSGLQGGMGMGGTGMSGIGMGGTGNSRN